MATGNLRLTSMSCKNCNKQTKFEKSSIVWGVGDLLMVLMTAGIWLFLKFIYNLMFNPWRCSSCGTRG